MAVSAGPEGLMPCDGTYGPYIRLSLNLSVTGSRVESVTYRVTDSPRGDDRSPPQSTIRRPSIPSSRSTRRRQETMATRCLRRCPRDGDHRPGGIGRRALSRRQRQTCPTSRSTTAIPSGQVTRTLQLLRAWLDLEARPWSNTSEYAGREGETTEEHIERVERLTEEAYAEYEALQPQIQAAREAYLESFRAHAATRESFEEWQRTLYVNSFTCAQRRARRGPPRGHGRVRKRGRADAPLSNHAGGRLRGGAL